jgi:hypothetical protein
MFTIPSLFQLLPHGGTIRAFDENLKPLRIDIYSPGGLGKIRVDGVHDENFPKNSLPTNRNKPELIFAPL